MDSGGWVVEHTPESFLFHSDFCQYNVLRSLIHSVIHFVIWYAL